MRNILNPSENDDRASCERCGATGLGPDDPCDCYEGEEEDFSVGGVPLQAVPGYSREDFYEMLTEDPMYGGLVDPDDPEIILVATVLKMDKMIQDLLKKTR